MRLYNAMDIKAGAKADYSRLGVFQQPLQFLPEKQKTDQWRMETMDWIEWEGMRQLRRTSRRLLKNYKLAKGIIDKTDYIVEDDNEMKDLIDVLTKDDESAFELKFYPLIPNIINVLTNEFSKRSTKIMYRAVDDVSYNEMLEEKRKMLEEVLMSDLEAKVSFNLMQAGVDMSSDEFKQETSPEKLRTLPEIEEFFRKDYRSLIEEWATHQHKVDEERFGMQEMEETAFRDMLTTDREFWHFNMLEDDYEIELWNPLLTFYHKSPDVRYISQGNFVGKIDLFTLADVIDKYGWMMNQEQLESLEGIYPAKSSAYAIEGYQNDGTFYDATKSHKWNVQLPSLGMRQYLSTHDSSGIGGGDIVEWILSDAEDTQDNGRQDLFRVSTIYWKTQKKVGHLTRVTSEGEIIQDIVSEDYKVTETPEYNTVFYKQKTKDNLIMGEHVDWIWINETWGGIKIGPNQPTFWGNNNPSNINPIYLGYKGNKPGKIPFQFKGDVTLYGCKLPVEGCIFGDRNIRSVSTVDSLKPAQIGFNMVNNQIADIIVDELGTVIMLDQNALPRHSLGEDWGKNNLAKAYVAMKNFGILPLDTSITNTENALNFQHYQPLNLEQTNRLLGRVQLATYFKNQAFEVIGLTPERMGQQIAQQETATGVEQAMNASYAQTEHLFIQHSDNLMPRVHQMRTDLAQYYNSKNPSVRLSYITSKDEKVNFNINGTELLMRDLNIFCTTNTNSRDIMKQLKQLAVNNNTMGASLYDLGNVLKADSIAELTGVLKDAEQKVQAQHQAEQEAQQKLQDDTIASQERMKQEELAYNVAKDDKMIQKDITVAEIRAAAMTGASDINENKINDYEDALDSIRSEQQYQDQMNLKRESELTKRDLGNKKLNLEQQAIQAKLSIADKQLQVAKENKNKYD